jgi:DNA-binding XRE family transcriptional regulator
MKNNVREARARTSWTQVDLANAVNVTTATINAVKHGRYDPTLMEALGTNIAEVFPPEFRRPAKESPSQKPWYLRWFSLS